MVVIEQKFTDGWYPLSEFKNRTEALRSLPKHDNRWQKGKTLYVSYNDGEKYRIRPSR